jgi:hypothetical protein
MFNPLNLIYQLCITLILTVLTASTMTSPVVGADISECNMKKTENDRNLCMAKYSGSATFCDRIKSYELRSDCYRMVIRKQREHR